MGNEQRKHKILTPEELRQFKGLESLSDEEATDKIASLEKLSILLFELYQKDKEKKEKSNSKARRKK